MDKIKNTFPIIKAEFGRSVWVLWIALFLLIPVCVGRTAQNIETIAYYSSVYLVPNIYLSSELQEIIYSASIFWAALLVFVQYTRDYPDFSRALPYTNKQLILAKSVTAAFISAVTAVVYAVVLFGFAEKNSWLINTVSWAFRDYYEDVFDKNFIVLSAFAAFAFAFAVYWFISLCCCVSKNAITGIALAVLAIFAFSGVMNILDNYILTDTDIVTPLRKLLQNFGAQNYTFTFLMLIVSLILFIPSFWAALRFYGGGESKHPLFRYDGAAITAIALVSIGAACFTPEFAEMRDNIPLALVIGGIIGLLMSLTINKLLIRRCQ